MRRSIVAEEDERAKSNRPCGENEGLSLVTLTIIARHNPSPAWIMPSRKEGKPALAELKRFSRNYFFRHSEGAQATVRVYWFQSDNRHICTH